MILHDENKYLLDAALWVIVDPWTWNEPGTLHKSLKDNLELHSIDINEYNNAFMDRLSVELNDIQNKQHIVVHCPNPETHIIHKLFKNYKRFTNANDLYANVHFDNIVICGFHYGICVNGLVERLMDINPMTKNIFVKRDLCCLMPYDTTHLKSKDEHIINLGAKLI